MDLKNLRIGYVPFSKDLQQPSDRRRFCYWARKRGIDFEVADPSKEYDIVLVTSHGDNPAIWSQYGGKAKVVFDLIDAYLLTPFYPKDFLMGIAGRLLGKTRFLTYKDAVKAMCRRADAVICSSEAQRKSILPYCSNVRIILDIHSAEVKEIKSDYAAGEVFKFVWEGLPHNIAFFENILPALQRLIEEHAFEIHLITDLSWRTDREHDTREITEKTFKGIPFHIHEWRLDTVASLINSSDMALIPVPTGNALVAAKPENKLLLLWRMGMPALTSSAECYESAMKRCGLDMACGTEQEWSDKLKRYILDESARREAGHKGRRCAEEHYGEESTLQKWDAALASVLIAPP
jgi:glycosyltransferase involved in cell wall biosynthesis